MLNIRYGFEYAQFSQCVSETLLFLNIYTVIMLCDAVK